MKNDFIIKKCLKCGATVEVLKPCSCQECGIMCCGEKMQAVIVNNKECSLEKHLPIYEKVGDYIVASVAHCMEENHFIEFIGLVSDNICAKKYFKIDEVPKAVFPYISGSKIVCLCNKHGVWETIVE